MVEEENDPPEPRNPQDTSPSVEILAISAIPANDNAYSDTVHGESDDGKGRQLIRDFEVRLRDVEDQELVRQVRFGALAEDEIARRVLSDSNLKALAKCRARNLPRTDPEDLLQDALVLALPRLRNGCPRKLGDYIAVIVRNQAAKLYRREKVATRATGVLASQSTHRVPPVGSSTRPEDADVEALLALSLSDLQYLSLVIIGLSWEEMGRRFGTSANAARCKVLRTISKFHRLRARAHRRRG